MWGSEMFKEKSMLVGEWTLLWPMRELSLNSCYCRRNCIYAPNIVICILTYKHMYCTGFRKKEQYVPSYMSFTIINESVARLQRNHKAAKNGKKKSGDKQQ